MHAATRWTLHRMLLLSALVSLTAFHADKVSAQTGDGLGLFSNTPATVFEQTEAGGTERFGFDTLISENLKPSHPLFDSISTDPDYRATLLALRRVFVSLNRTALATSKKANLSDLERTTALADLTKQWELNVKAILGKSDEKVQLWRPLVKLVRGHLSELQKASSNAAPAPAPVPAPPVDEPAPPSTQVVPAPALSFVSSLRLAQGPVSSFDVNSLSHRATIYHELAEGLKLAVQQYDQYKAFANSIKDKLQIPDAAGTGLDTSWDTQRCRRRKRHPCGLLF